MRAAFAGLKADVVVGRLAVAGLLAWMGWIHLHLWVNGYNSIPASDGGDVIGPLFMANFAVAVAVGLAVLAVPTRILWLPAAGAVLLSLGTLGGLLVSTHGGLFGFKDSLSAPFAGESLVVEAVAAGVSLALAVRAGLAGGGGGRRGRDRRGAAGLGRTEQGRTEQ